VKTTQAYTAYARQYEATYVLLYLIGAGVTPAAELCAVGS